MTIYTKAQRRLQEKYQSARLAAAAEKAIIDDELNEAHTAFIQSRDFFFLSTVNSHGEPTVSYKGGDVGVVKVIDSTTIAFPAYDGNGMFLSLGNIEDTAKIGLLFIDFETPNRVRVQATASYHADDELLSTYPAAIGIVRAQVDKVFLNCARYIHKHARLEASPYVPDAEGHQPYPAWKRLDKIQDHLQPSDLGRAASEGGVISDEQYAELLSAGKS